MTKAILFDLDGVLTDTAAYHYQAWKRLATEIGLPFDEALNDRLRGVSRRESLAIMLQGTTVTEEEAHRLMEKKNAYYQTLIRSMTPSELFPGVKEIFSLLRRHHIAIAIASVSKNANQVVTQLGIGDDIDALIDGTVVSVSKPEPDIFLFAAHQLGVAPATCVVVEDAASGVVAAHKAGMFCVGIGPAAQGAEIMIQTIGEFRPEQFVKGGELWQRTLR
jgi:beta-phosphoglucomutase